MMHAKVTAFKGHIITELLTTKSIDNEVATSLDLPGRFGQVIMHTEKFLGVSEEAIALMKMVPRGRDDIGEVDWFETKTLDGQPNGHAFAWIGGPKAMHPVKEITTSRSFKMGEYISIPNEVPQGAIDAIDGA